MTNCGACEFFTAYRGHLRSRGSCSALAISTPAFTNWNTCREFRMPKPPVKYRKPMKGIPIGSFEQIKDAAGKATLKPKVSRKTSVSAKIAMRNSKKVKPVRRGA